MLWRCFAWLLALSLIFTSIHSGYSWPPPEPKHAPLSAGCTDLLRLVSFQANDRGLKDQVFWAFHPITYDARARAETLRNLKRKFGKIRFLEMTAMPSPRRIWKLLQTAPWKVEQFVYSLGPDELVLLADIYMGYERFVQSLLNRSAKNPQLGLCEGHEISLGEHLTDRDWERAFFEIAVHGLSSRVYRLLESRLPVLKTISNWVLDRWIRREPLDFHMYRMRLPLPEFLQRYRERIELMGGIEVDVRPSQPPVPVTFINESDGSPVEIRATVSFHPYRFLTSRLYDAFSIYLDNRAKGLEISRWFEHSSEFRKLELLQEARSYGWWHSDLPWLWAGVFVATSWVLFLIGKAMMVLP